MTIWQFILLASIVVLALKVSGYLVPAAVLEKPTPSRVANLLTVALLAALVVSQTLAAGNSIVVDARVPALIVAAGLLVVRAPFIVVVAAAALTAALIRAFT
ncbi:AzlD domain-containing protein [Salinibacterium sp. ZJ454]|uniref:AzlD domain-containing protein n=1 Tax=Salinibacterium sp. ZJ454 TaxID=2708339 RepID=UPI0014233AF3|nr:AzlD domain-containing protein [Salinibacterium sp. ZJ454]